MNDDLINVLTVLSGQQGPDGVFAQCLSRIKADSQRMEVMAAALVEARSALKWCYNVTDWPADGDTEQDRAIKAIDEALSKAKGEAQ